MGEQRRISQKRPQDGQGNNRHLPVHPLGYSDGREQASPGRALTRLSASKIRAKAHGPPQGHHGPEVTWRGEALSSPSGCGKAPSWDKRKSRGRLSGQGFAASRARSRSSPEERRTEPQKTGTTKETRYGRMDPAWRMAGWETQRYGGGRQEGSRPG